MNIERKSIDGGRTHYYTVLVAAGELVYAGTAVPYSTWIGTLTVREDHVEARVWVPAADLPVPASEHVCRSPEDCYCHERFAARVERDYYKPHAKEMLRQAAWTLRADLEVRFT